MEDIKIFIVTHKECQLPVIKGYYSLLVGADRKSLSQRFDFYDNVGENISDKNASYCELTGLYWIWKNINADILGLCHYRRFFTSAKISTDEKYYLRQEQIKDIMINHDIIMPKRLLYWKSIKESVREAPNKTDLEEIRIALETLYPDYIPDYDLYLNQRSWYMYNMCIMKKKLFDEYCEWIFKVLKYIEARHDMSKESGYRTRLFGFLSERLIWVWVNHNIPKERIKEVRVIRTDMGIATKIKKEITNGIKCLAALISGEYY